MGMMDLFICMMRMIIDHTTPMTSAIRLRWLLFINTNDEDDDGIGPSKKEKESILIPSLEMTLIEEKRRKRISKSG